MTKHHLTLSKYSKKITEIVWTPRVSHLLRPTSVTVIVVFMISLYGLGFYGWSVYLAMDRWAYLRSLPKRDFDMVDDALHALNEEEKKLAVFLIPVAASLAYMLRRITWIPHQCYYCGKYMRRKHARKTPDGAFWYHERCQLKAENAWNR